MTFNENLPIDPGRASSGGGPGRNGKLALGGGAGGLIVLVLALLMGGDPGSTLGQFTGAQDVQTSPTVGTPEHCRTGADANTYVDCRVVLTAQSLDAVWGQELPDQTGVTYEPPGLRLFTGSVSTGCGYATSEVGPFYCPADRTAYCDVGFFQELVDRFGATGGPLAQEYVVAHEFGHHIQTLLGDIGRARQDPQGPESGAVRTELQADCYAGIWAHYADRTPAPGSDTPFLQPLDDVDIGDALSAAAAVGDDRIQESVQGRMNPEVWTHGASEQRQGWFLAGYRTGEVRSCDTFSATDLSNPADLR
jgi:uncharacterized protein